MAARRRSAALLVALVIVVVHPLNSDAKRRENVVFFGTTTPPCWSRMEGRREYGHLSLTGRSIKKLQMLQRLYRVHLSTPFPVEKEPFALQLCSSL